LEEDIMNSEHSEQILTEEIRDFLTVEQWLNQISNRVEYGGFAYKLVQAYMHADKSNRRRIALGYPCLAVAYHRYSLGGRNS
jgi:hypothetical protein